LHLRSTIGPVYRASIEDRKAENDMTMLLTYEIVHKFRGQGKMNEAEDWMRENIRGQWELQFLGMSEEIDDFKKTKSFIFHVRFNFGRSEDMKRFKEEYIEGKPRAPKAKAPPPKKKGFFGRLFD
jgi:hypothetical protein